jgi:hypothetical protein
LEEKNICLSQQEGPSNGRPAGTNISPAKADADAQRNSEQLSRLLGKAAHAAGVHARTALRHAKEAGGDSCFIVREDEAMIGPLEMADPLEAQLSLVDGDLIRKAEEAGLHPLYLSRILGQMPRTVKLEYNVHELASVLGVTIRTTHRLLLQWVDAGLVETVREERGIAAKGRPRQVFRFRSLEQLLKTYREGTSSP